MKDIEIKNILRRAHFWLKEDPTNKKACKIFCAGHMSISVVLITLLISEPLYNYIGGIVKLGVPLITAVCGIFLTMIALTFLILREIFEITTGQKVRLPLRYKVLLSALAIPFILLAHKILIAPFMKNYESKNLPSR